MPQDGSRERGWNLLFAPEPGWLRIAPDFPLICPLFPPEKSFTPRWGLLGFLQGLQKKLGFQLTFLEIFPIMRNIKSSVFEKKAKKLVLEATYLGKGRKMGCCNK